MHPSLLLSYAFEVPAPIHLYGVEFFGEHVGGVEHEVVCCAVPENVSKNDSHLQAIARTCVQCFSDA